MKEDLIINVIGHGKEVVKKNSSILELVNKLGYQDVMAAKIDDEFLNLNIGFSNDCDLSLVRVSDKAGHRMYVAGLKFIFIVAVHEIYGRDAVVNIKHSIDKGTYCTLDIKKKLTNEDVEKIKIRMYEYVDRNLPFEKINADKITAVKYLIHENELEKAENVNKTVYETLSLYKLFDYYNFFYVDLPVSTGCITKFDLKKITDNGVILEYPERENPTVVPEYTHYETIFRSFDIYDQWLKLINVSYVPKLNEYVARGDSSTLIKMCEIMYDNQISRIVEDIFIHKKDVKILLLGGPSSSGKTTSSKKFGLFLKAAGYEPLVISVDDYFEERENCPKDENGNYDFECLEAVDLKLFNKNLNALINGKEIKNPRFNFITGKKEYNDKDTSKLGDKGIIVIEGLHCINEKLTSEIPKDKKYKVYVSPFNAMTIDRHNHISTVDMRFLRRMVRDNLYRGYSPEHTLKNWPTVRNGEKKYLFPYLAEADIVLNTALIYEVGVLKVYAEPLLYSITPNSPYYDESRRILNFLNCFFSIPSECVPDDSILREFIGGSYFNQD